MYSGLVRLVVGLERRLVRRRFGGVLRGGDGEPGEFALLAG